MGKRGEVAGAAETAVLVDDRRKAGVEHVDVAPKRLFTDTGAAGGGVEIRSSMRARTTSRSTSGPDPAAWERIRLRCSWPRRSIGMCRVAGAPKPVDTP